MVKNKIKRAVSNAIKNLEGEFSISLRGTPIKIEYSSEKFHGDWTTNVAFFLAPKLKEKPIKIAELLKENLRPFLFGIVERIEIAEPGFVNFFVSKEFLEKEIENALKNKEKFLYPNIGKGRRVHIEFISANPTGQLHIGHGRGAFFGYSLAKLLEKVGWNVWREYFVNDGIFNTQIRTLGKTALGKGKEYMNEWLAEKIKRLSGKLMKISEEGEAGYILAKEVQKEIRFFIEKKLHMRFNRWVSEQELFLRSKMKKAFNVLKRMGMIYEKQGAQWLSMERLGSNKDEVLIKQDGSPTYFLSDIAYHIEKFKGNFAKIINIWGADHQAHAERIMKISQLWGYKGELKILLSQLVRLKGRGKLSKRKGEIVTLEELIDNVGIDHLRFFYLLKSLDSQMELDLRVMKEHSKKNPLYYIQYAYARINSIMKKIKKEKILNFEQNGLESLKEIELAKKIIIFPEVLEISAKDYQLQRLTQYAIELAHDFHSFYQAHRVILKQKKIHSLRYSLMILTKSILETLFEIWGIKPPEIM